MEAGILRWYTYLFVIEFNYHPARHVLGKEVKRSAYRINAMDTPAPPLASRCSRKPLTVRKSFFPLFRWKGNMQAPST
jgi:hypothetical protein